MREICPIDPEYESADSGVKITNGNAIFYFNITVSMCMCFWC